MHKKLKIYGVHTLYDHFLHLWSRMYIPYIFSKGNDLLLWFARLFLTAASGKKKNSSWMVESRIRGAKFCGDASEVGNERGSLMKVHHPMRKISWKTPKPKVEFQKVVEFFVSFFSWFLVTRCHWSLGNLAFGKGRRASVLDQSLPMRWKQSETTSFAICLVWFSVILLFFHAPQILWRGPWSLLVCGQERFGTVLCGQLGSSLHSCSALRSGPESSLVVFEGDWNPLAHRFLHQ